jgi:hypothetical protein
MENRMKRVTIALLAGLLTMSPVPAQQQAAHAEEGGGKPKLAELMLMVQIRHTKLSLAGEARNWPLAEFQIEELKEVLEDVETHYPTFKDIPIKQMVETIAMPPIAEVEKAVAAKNRGRFVQSFAKLTAACNACHHGAHVDFVVIRRPAQSAFPNQDFAPARK